MTSLTSNPFFESLRHELFCSEEKTRLNILRKNCRSEDGCHGIEAQCIETTNELANYLSNCRYPKPDGAELYLSIAQAYSWGRLLLTSKAFDSITDALDPDPHLLDIVVGFGVKVSDDERKIFKHHFCGNTRSCDRPRHTISYIIYYVEKHGRQLSDPWSLRQVGIYQQWNESGSTWIILNPSDGIEAALRNHLTIRSCQCALALHISFISTLAGNWIEYLEYINGETKQLYDTSCFSKVDQINDDGPSATYTDLKKAHRLQAKLQRADASVESCLSIAQELERYSAAHWSPVQNSACSDCSDILNSYISDMRSYRNRLRFLNTRLQNTLNMLSKIIEYRNEELFQFTRQASSKTLDTLVSITEQGKQQQATLTGLLSQGRADSALLKALSIVATIYLPASLIASVFSSSLIQPISGDAGSGAAQHLALSPQFWVYPVVTIPFMVITFAWILYLDRRTRRQRLTISLEAEKARA